MLSLGLNSLFSSKLQFIKVSGIWLFRQWQDKLLKDFEMEARYLEYFLLFEYFFVDRRDFLVWSRFEFEFDLFLVLGLLVLVLLLPFLDLLLPYLQTFRLILTPLLLFIKAGDIFGPVGVLAFGSTGWVIKHNPVLGSQNCDGFMLVMSSASVKVVSNIDWNLWNIFRFCLCVTLVTYVIKFFVLVIFLTYFISIFYI